MADTQTDQPAGELALVEDPGQIAQALAGMIEATFEDPSAVQAAIAVRILSAATQEEAFTDPPTWNTEDLVGVPIEVDAVRMAQSKYGADGKGAFLVCSCTRLDTGEVGIFTTSSIKVGARIMWCRLHDLLPVRLQVRQPVNSGQGRQVYDVEAI